MTHTRTRIGIAVLALSFALTSSHAYAEEQLVFEFDSLRQFVARTLVFDADDRGGDIVLQFGSTLNKTLSYDSIRGIFRFNDDLWISGTASGRYLHAESGLSSSGTFVVEHIAQAGNEQLGVFTDGTDSLIISNGSIGSELGITTGNDQIIGAIDKFASNDTYYYANGTIVASGSRVAINNPGGASPFRPDTELEVIGTVSGSSIRSFGLDSDCDNATTSKLLWDSTTGRFSCGTDQSGGSFGSGNVITIGDGRYVNVSGDTMTGGLAIQNGNTHTPTGTPLINVRGTMSGRSLYISGTGAAARPLISTNVVTGRVGIGTSNPADLLTVSGGGIWTTGAVRDALGWSTNTVNQAKMSLGVSMGGMGGTTTNPGRTFTLSGSWAAYDPGANGVGTDPDGYEGAAFDGRYVYFAPSVNDGAANGHGEVLRYDTTLAFNTTAAWTTYDPGSNGIGADADGYSGVVFDGRYLYFVPAYNGSAYHGEVLRYDTHKEFKSTQSWAAYDPGSNGVGSDPDGYWGGLFDGRYVYFIPDHNGTARHGEVLRYDTTGGFSTKGSWTTYDPGANGVGSDADGYIGGTFDGRYLYFAPYNNGTAEHGEVLRYDTTGAFHTTGSWSTFDPGSNGVGTDPDGYFGAVFDGRYVYFTPHDPGATNGGEVMRYDTASTFAAASSWTTFDPGANGLGTDLDGFYGSYFDGRYVYFAQYHNGSANAGEMMRYDSTKPFNLVSSWEAFDPGSNKVGTDPDGYGCIISDGRYLYYCPVNNGTSGHGEVLRFDTGSPAPEPTAAHLAKSPELFVGSGSNAFVGIGTNTPMAKLAVSGSMIIGLNVNSRADARLEVQGIMSGTTVYATRSFSGAGLSDCDAAGQKLLWDSSTGRFSCGTDASGSFGTGNVLTIGDSRYVNVSGDTMTGALTVQNGNTHTPTGTPLINVRGTVSGSTLFANNALRSSGTLVWEGAGSGASLALAGGNVTVSRSGATVFNANARNIDFTIGGLANPNLFFIDANANDSGAVGIGTRIPSQRLSVMSGGFLQAPGGTLRSMSGVVTETDGRALHVQGNTAVFGTTNGESGTCSGTTVDGCELRIYDVSNPNHIHPLGGIEFDTDGVRTVFLDNRYLYVATLGSSRFHIYDISTPSNPVLLYRTLSFGTPATILVEGRYAYIGLEDEAGACAPGTHVGCDFIILDVSNPRSPQFIGGADMGGSVYGMVIDGNRAHLVMNNIGGQEYVILDISNPANPKKMGGVDVDTTAYDIAVQGKYAYVVTSGVSGTCAGATHTGCEFRIYDISNPASPTAVGGASIGDFSDAYAVEAAGAYAYIGTGDSTKIINITNPALPQFVAQHTEDSGLVRRLNVVGKYAYAAQWFTTPQFRIIDLQGLDASSGRIGSLEAGTLHVTGDAVIRGNTHVSNGLSVGQGGIRSEGPLSIQSAGRNATGGLISAFDVRDSTGVTLFSVRSNGNVGIGTGSGQLSAPETKLEVTGIMSGTTIYATKSFSGAGLSDCDTASTSKLLWDSSTGRFSCGTDQSGGAGTFGSGNVITIGDGRYVNTGGDTMTGTLVIRSSSGVSLVGLNVIGGISGAFLKASQSLSASGNLFIERGGFFGSGVVISRPEDQAFLTLKDTTNNDDVSVRTGSGTPNGVVSAQLGSLYIDHFTGKVYKNNNGATQWVELTSGSGTLHMAKMTRNAAQSIPTGSSEKILFDTEVFDIGDIADSVTNDRFDIKKSGQYLITTFFAMPNVMDIGERISLLIFVNGAAIMDHTNVSAAANDDVLRLEASDVLRLNAGDYVEMYVYHTEGASQNTEASAALRPRMSVIQLQDQTAASFWTGSGANIYNNNSGNVGIGVTDDAKTKLEVNGTMSGNALYIARAFSGAGLSDCDNATTSKLLWDSSTGRFSCGTDQSGGAGGLVDHYVNAGGDTMTGALNIRVTGGTPTTQSLNVAGLMSGTTIRITGTGAFNAPLITTDLRFGTILMGTGGIQDGARRIMPNLLVKNRLPDSFIGSATMTGNANQLAVQGNYAYVVTEIGANALEIFDVTNPNSPTLVGTLNVGNAPQAVAVQGRYAYILDPLTVVDISNPSAPAIVGSVNVSGGNYHIAVQGSYVYIPSQASDALEIVDISNPRSPVLVGSVSTGTDPWAVAIQGHYAYVSDSGSSQFSVVDISNPQKPTVVATRSTGSNPFGITVQGRYLYVSNDNGIEVYDISDPTSIPSVVGSQAVSALAFSLTVQGKTLYGASYNNSTVHVLDISDPTKPLEIGTIAHSGADGVAVQGRYLYVSGYDSQTIRVYDMGGAYIDQLEAGATQVSSLNALTYASVGHNLSVGGGVSVAQGVNIAGALNVHQTSTGSFAATIAGSTGALRIGAQGTTLKPHLEFGTGTTFDTNLFRISANTLHTDDAFSISGALMLESSLTGATINGFGLGNDCDGTANKITWDAATQRFKCEADQSGGAAGLVDHYVNVGGDTMTGALVVQNGTTHTPTTTPLLNIRGTMSGRSIVVTGSGAANHPLLATDVSRGSVGIGTATPSEALTMSGGIFLQTPGALRAASGINIWASIATRVVTDGKYAYYFGSDGTNNLYIADISNPDAPFNVDSISASATYISLVVQGNYLYAGGVDGGINGILAIYDISNRTNPVLLSSLNVAAFSYVYDVELRGQYLYGAIYDLLAGETTLAVLNIANPSKPQVVSTSDFGSGSLTLAIRDNYLYQGTLSSNTNGSEFNILDISNPEDPVYKGGINLTNETVYPYDIAVRGAYAYVGLYSGVTAGGELRILDISDPSSPTEVGSLETGSGVISIVLMGDYAYISVGSDTGDNITGDEIRIVDITDPTSPTVVGGMELGYPAMLSGYGNLLLASLSSLGGDPTGNDFRIYRASGTETPAASIGLLQTGDIAIRNNMSVGNFATVGNALSVGKGGIFSQGPLMGSSAGSGASTLPGLTIRNSTGITLFTTLSNGISSGTTLYARTALRSSGSLVFEGAASGSSLYLGTRLDGAGLSDCDNATTSKLLWDSSTGRFSCGTDQSGGAGGLVDHYVRTGGDTMTGTLVIRSSSGVSLVGLNVIGGISGAFLKASQSLSASGNLFIERGGFFGSGVVISRPEDQAFLTLKDTTNNDDVSVRTGSGTPNGVVSAQLGSLYIDHFTGKVYKNNNGATQWVELTSGSGTLHMAEMTRASAQSIDTTTVTKILFDTEVYDVGGIADSVTNDRFDIAKPGKYYISANWGLNATLDDTEEIYVAIYKNGVAMRNSRFQASGTNKYNTAQVSGILDLVPGDQITMFVYHDEGASVNTETTQYNMPRMSVIQLQDQTAASFWTGSGANIYNNNSGNVGIGVTDDAKTKLEVNGTMSGNALYIARAFSGAGLSDCDNATTSKLLWDSSTGRFSCGTDQSGGAGGLVDHYVNAGGDTMTGALTIDLNGTGNGTGLILREKAYFASGATLSGSFILKSRNDPPAPANGDFALYTKKIANRTMLKGRGPSGLDYPYQPSFFQNQICMLSAGAGTTINSVGCSATNDTTVSHPAVTETYGFMANFATNTTLNDTAGTASNVVSFFRGSTTGANGFFYNARVAVVNATSIRLFSGLSNQTSGTMVTNDNPAGHYAGFQFSTNRGDTNWQFMTKDNTTQNVTDTGMAVTAANVYDMYIFCTPQCSTMYWRVDNVTAGTTAEGSTSSNLPGGSTAMRGIGASVSTLTTAARNFRMQRMYVESDR